MVKVIRKNKCYKEILTFVSTCYRSNKSTNVPKNNVTIEPLVLKVRHSTGDNVENNVTYNTKYMLYVM